MSIEAPVQAENALQAIKSKPAASTGSQHTSQEGQEQRMANENELNDDHCFKCSRKGELYCCDRCFRAFHKHCIATKRFSKVWTCEYCNSAAHCLACQQAFKPPELQDAGQQLCTCTICFRAVHKECCELPPQLAEMQSHFFSGSENFVCEQCIRQFGFRIVLSYQRVWVRGEEKLFYFVSINTRSPLHCGWFEEDALRDIPRCKEADELREAEVYEVPTIERIVRIKFPSQIKREDYELTIGQLLESGFSRAPYGKADNFFCLVVWQGRDLSGATWEDQNVVAIHNTKNASCRQLVKYLLFRKLEIALREKKSLPDVNAFFERHIPNPPVRLPASHASLYEHFKANLSSASTVFCLFGDNNLHYSEVVDFLCFSLQQAYRRNLLATPILLVCSTAVRWERRLKELCPQLNVVVLKGSEGNIYEIKQKELFFESVHQAKFQVMIIPQERWNKEKKYLSGNPLPVASIFFDLGQPELIDDELTSDKQLPYERRLFMVENRRMLSRMLLTNRSRQVINLADGHEDTLVYDFCTAQVLNSDLREVTRHVDAGLELQRIGAEDQRTFRNGRWDELKRLTFLRYVLAFGFSHSPEEQYERLLSFDKGTFAREAGELERMRRHSERMMALLFDYKNLIPREEYHGYYLFNLPVAAVYKRVCKLARLRQLAQRYRSDCEGFPQPRRMKVFMGISVEEVGHWRGEHDYLLAALVLERGFGKWVEMAQDREWQKWTSSCHLQPFGSLRRPSSANFGEFVKEIIQVSIGREIKSFVKVAEILRERAEYLLTLSC